LVEVQKVWGWYHLRLQDTTRAEQHYAAVLRQEPSDVDALLALAGFQVKRGESDSAEVMLEKAGDLDPRSARTARVIGDWYLSAGRPEDALTYRERYMALAANQPFTYYIVGYTHMRLGDTAAVHGILQLGAERVGLVNLLVVMARPTLGHAWFRMFDDYGEVMRRLPQDAFGDDRGDYLLAKAHSYYASPDLARPYFDSLAVVVRAWQQANPDFPAYRALLAHAYAGIGRTEAAIEEADAFLEMNAAPWNRYLVAEAYLMLGEHDAAVEQIRRVVSGEFIGGVTPGGIPHSYFRFDPFWDPMRDHPGFRELLEGGN
jgi:predicted Zn-dependent protease